ncbi:hypothetical protein ABLE68_20590 [Nocardioides sp. CN2-186]|uniref:hypothetical protein n=1 Tax=Nocardioides tweenelious TaxID=3156607 RepID=UPI0032B4C177
MTTLHDRLADLAGEAPAAVPDPGLWDRGRRYHRRRRAGTVVIAAAAAVLLATIATVDWQRSAPTPVPAEGPAGLPNRMWAPGPWLPSTETPGQLVAITSADRGSWTGSHAGTVGVSATSGDYAFVDLPDADLEYADVDLAPDGRHVAYWLTGPTTGTPNTADGPIAGVAVYDLVTGEVTRHWIDTAHGLRPDFLTWADAATVVFSAGQIVGGDDASDMDRSSSRFGTVTAWRLGAAPVAVPGVPAGASLMGAAHGRILMNHRLVALDESERARRISYPAVSGAFGSMHFIGLGPSGDEIAAVFGNRSPNDVMAGPAADLRVVSGTHGSFGVVDWLDPDAIVTLQRIGGWRTGKTALVKHSLTGGETQELVRFPTDSLGGGWQFATDLLSSPSVDAERPASPMDPRLAAGLAAAVCLAAAAGLLIWRRRVRP